MRCTRWTLLWLAGVVACGEDDVGTASGEPLDLRLERVASGLQVPLLVTAPFNDPQRLFVVEKRGVVRVIKNGSLRSTPFLDLSAKVSTGGEQGLLGLAFHPEYDRNGIVVASYTDLAGDTRISTVKVSADPDVADPASEKIILAVDQPFANHNGGHVTFGPLGFLYIGLGDGGSSGDPNNQARAVGSLLGKILRLSVDDVGNAKIPAGNPFVGQPLFRWEIWSGGLRNPWRFAFDPETSDLYIGDVGQDRQEEIDVSPATQGAGRGADYGWSVMEGRLCFKPAVDCDPGQMTLPVLVYDHSQGCSVTGGFVYRGDRMPELRGTYFYGDFCAGWVRSFRFSGGTAAEQREWPGLTVSQLTSFGEDARGELYITSGTGTVHRIVPR